MDVEPKKSGPRWLWLLVALIAIVFLLVLIRGCSDHTDEVVTDDTTYDKKVIAGTQPAWRSVDFLSPALLDADLNTIDSGSKIENIKSVALATNTSTK